MEKQNDWLWSICYNRIWNVPNFTILKRLNLFITSLKIIIIIIIDSNEKNNNNWQDQMDP